MQKGKKSLPAIIMSIAMVLSLALPAYADNDPATGDTTGDSTFHSSLTAPLNFDGSKPDSSAVEVNNAAPAYDLEAAQAPAPVTTLMTDGNGGTLSLITADKYFYTTNYMVTNGAWYMLELQNFFASHDASYSYIVRIGTTSSNVQTADNGLYFYLNQSGADGCFSGNITSLITNDSANLYIEVFEGSSTLLYYTENPIATTFVHDTTATLASGKYIYSGNLSSDLSLIVPDGLSDAADCEVDLLNSSGETVATTISGMSNADIYTTSTQETRYNNVFGDCFSSSSYESSELNAMVYFAQKLAAGTYDVKVSDGTTSNTYKQLVTVVDEPVVNNFYYMSYNGFAPPVYGGNSAYVLVNADGAGLNDFTVSIINKAKNTVGTTTSSRYYQGNLLYMVTLNGVGTFVNTEQYSIKLTYNGTKNIYYAPDTVSNLGVSSDFNVYSVTFNEEADQADLTLKAVNPPAETTVTLGLFRDWDSEEPLSTADVTLGSTMTVKFTDGVKTEPLTLDTGSYYIMMKFTMGTYSSWRYFTNFYVYPSGNSSGNEYYEDAGLGAYKTTDTSYAVNIFLSKAYFGLNNSTYSANLTDSNSNIVGTLNGSLSAYDSYYYFGSDSQIPAVNLTGNITLQSGAKTEGVYNLNITAETGTTNQTITINVSCLDPEKVYELNCYPQLSTNGISSSIYNPSNIALTPSKLLYEVKDLNGNIIQSVTPAVSQYYDYFWYINATFSTPVAPGYYSVELKYDGKTIYNFNDPSSPLQSGYSLYDEIAVKPELKSFNFNSSQECYACTIDKGTAANLSVYAYVYDYSDATNFTPVKVITMVKNPSTGLYEFSTLAGIVSGKAYDLELVDGNGIQIGSVDNEMLGAADEASSGAAVTVSVNGTSVTFNTGNTAACTAVVAVYDTTGKMLGVGVTPLALNQTAANVTVTASSLPTAYKIKLILLDSNSKPICDYLSYS